MRQSTPDVEGVLRVSKALKHQVLLDADEMEALFAHLSPFHIYNVSEPVTDGEVSKEEFLEGYAAYIASLKENRTVNVRRLFSGVWSVDPEAVYAMPVAGGKFLIKTIQPVIQLQEHRFMASEVDGKIHPMVLGEGSIRWGIQFSYPQLYQHPQTQDIAKVTAALPNTALYSALSRWLRHNTLPTPFLFQGKRTNSPIRIGKRCFEWIATHPDLKNIQVVHGN